MSPLAAIDTLCPLLKRHLSPDRTDSLLLLYCIATVTGERVLMPIAVAVNHKWIGWLRGPISPIFAAVLIPLPLRARLLGVVVGTVGIRWTVVGEAGSHIRAVTLPSRIFTDTVTVGRRTVILEL